MQRLCAIALAPHTLRPHAWDMTEMLWLLIIIGAAALFWDASRRAADLATVLGRDACQRAGVQWLDQSVHADGLRLRRNADGRMGLERRYRFEYSEDGNDRHVGQLVLHGGKLVGFSGPSGALNAMQLR